MLHVHCIKFLIILGLRSHKCIYHFIFLSTFTNTFSSNTWQKQPVSKDHFSCPISCADMHIHYRLIASKRNFSSSCAKKNGSIHGTSANFTCHAWGEDYRKHGKVRGKLHVHVQYCMVIMKVKVM